MIERLVYQSRKTADGAVSALGNRGEQWSPRGTEAVIADITSGRACYRVPWRTITVPVMVSEDGTSIRAETADGEPNGLLVLPDG